MHGVASEDFVTCFHDDELWLEVNAPLREQHFTEGIKRRYQGDKEKKPAHPEGHDLPSADTGSCTG